MHTDIGKLWHSLKHKVSNKQFLLKRIFSSISQNIGQFPVLSPTFLGFPGQCSSEHRVGLLPEVVELSRTILEPFPSLMSLSVSQTVWIIGRQKAYKQHQTSCTIHRTYMHFSLIIISTVYSTNMISFSKHFTARIQVLWIYQLMTQQLMVRACSAALVDPVEHV